MHVGFTGTRKGMTKAQLHEIKLLIWTFAHQASVMDWHDGDCLGADDQAHDIAKKAGYYLIGHPPINPKYRAFNAFDQMEPEKDYLDRNSDIVTAANVLLAAPETMEEIQRSGTWSTIRKARAKIIPIYIVFPDGTIKKENDG